MKPTFRTAFLIVFLTASALVAGMSYFLFSPTVKEPNGFVYYLKPGTAKKTLLTELTQQNIIKNPGFFSAFLYLQNSDKIKTGEYFFPNGSTPYSIWKQISTGTGLYYRSFTIVPGWSFAQLRQELAKDPMLRPVTKSWDEGDIMNTVGFGSLAAEGEFFPETYNYTRNNADIVIMKRAIDLMQNRFNEAWQKRAPNLPYKSSYEGLIAASLIEKEAYLDSERPMIAGVLVNRLRKNMLLQFDPTVIYGMGERYNGKIHREDLRAKTPYNTYVNKGLPPTPIAMPSMASIEAALHPEQNEFLYFVARGDGSHQFSKTLPEHNAAVAAAIAPKKEIKG